MEKLIFKVINCNGIEVTYKYYLPTDYLSLVDYSNDEESMELPSLDDEVTEMEYYGTKISLNCNNIKTVSDIYDYCCSRE